MLEPRRVNPLAQGLYGDQMKNSYEGMKTFLRWIVVGIISFIIALPTLIFLTVDK
jgi:hypothetical protein